MDNKATKLPGVRLLVPRVFKDARGSFSETWNDSALRKAGVELTFVQDNQSVNPKTGTIRALHYQGPEFAQDKLVRVVRGAVLDVAVDVRVGSPHYGDWVGVELSEDNALQLLVPKGFLHGFVTRAPDTVVLYKTTDVYAPDFDGGVHFADSELAIDWGIPTDEALVSDKDAHAPTLAEWKSPFVYEETS